MQLRKKLYEGIGTVDRVIESANLGTWSLDLSTGLVTLSWRCREIIDMPPELSPSIEDFKKLVKAEYLIKALDTFTLGKANADILTLELPIAAYTNLSTRWLKLTAVIIFDHQDVPAELHGTMLDITEWKMADKLKQDMLAMVCHDMCTPLAVVKLCVQMGMRVADKINDDLMFSMMQRADKQLNNINRMIQSFLDKSLMQSGQAIFNPELFQINELLQEVAADMELLNCRCKLIIQPGTQARVYADRHKIGEVLYNLLTNAIKYSPGKNMVQLTGTITGDRVQIAVKDFGIGVKKADQDKIFNQFYRVENETTGGICGYGMGLFIAKQIILQHRGLIWVESEENRGSTFYFTLPLVKN